MPKVVLAGVATLVLLAAAPAQALTIGLFSYVRLGQAVVFDANSAAGARNRIRHPRGTRHGRHRRLVPQPGGRGLLPSTWTGA